MFICVVLFDVNHIYIYIQVFLIGLNIFIILVYFFKRFMKLANSFIDFYGV